MSLSPGLPWCPRWPPPLEHNSLVPVQMCSAVGRCVDLCAPRYLPCLSAVHHHGSDVISCRLNILDEWLFHDLHILFLIFLLKCITILVAINTFTLKSCCSRFIVFSPKGGNTPTPLLYQKHAREVSGERHCRIQRGAWRSQM